MFPPRIIYCLLLNILIVATQHAQSAKDKDNRPLVLATTSILDDMAEVIGGGLLRVETVVPAGVDPHGYRLTDQNLDQLRAADLILRNGLGLDDWLVPQAEKYGTAAPITVVSADIQQPGEDEADPHAWMTAANGIVYARNILAALSALDPANADIYQFNHDIYRRQLADLEQAIVKQIAAIPADRRYLGPVPGLAYYTRYYGIRTEHGEGMTTIFQDTLYVDALSDPTGPAATYPELLRHATNLVTKAMEANPPLSGVKQTGRPVWWKAVAIAMAGLLLLVFIGSAYHLTRSK